MTMSAVAKTDAKGFQLKGWHVLAIFLSMFLSVTAVNAFMIYRAVTTFGGLDTPDAYRKGLQYNREIADQRTQDALGWTDAVKFDSKTGDLMVTYTGPGGAQLSELEVTAALDRPATTRFDQDIKLQPAGDGSYRADLAGLAPGTWILSLTATQAAGNSAPSIYRSKVRLWKAP
jgi:nitrogen fixation protein FixH